MLEFNQQSAHSNQAMASSDVEIEQNAVITDAQPKTRIPVETLYISLQIVAHRFDLGKYALRHLLGQLLEVAKGGRGDLQLEAH